MFANALRHSRHALRFMAQEPAYALAFVLTLGLGIGANTAIFSLVNGVLLRPLPYPDAERIMILQQPSHARGQDDMGFSFAEIEDYRQSADSLEEIVEFGDWTFQVIDQGDPHRAVGGLVTANFFDVLGMRAQLGRTLRPEDRGTGAAPVVVLTDEYWERVFGRDPEVVGKILNLTVKQAEIVGVLAPGSHYATERAQDFYVNYAANSHYVGASMQEERSHRMTTVFAKLAPGATRERAQAQLEGIAGTLHEEHPDHYPASLDMGIVVSSWRDEITKRARPTLLILLGTALFVLVIACANVANLTLTRLIRRERELAVRTALGARGRDIRGLLFVENLVLAVVGAALGLAVAYGGLGMLVSYTARFTSRTGEITIDAAVLGITLVSAIGAALVFAMMPGVAADKNLGATLVTGGGHATVSAGKRRAQRMLVLGQVAVSFMLLVGAGLLLRTLMNLYAVDPGFDLENVLSLDAPSVTASGDEARVFGDRLMEEVKAHPAVEHAALTMSAPLSGASAFPMMVRTVGAPQDTDPPLVPTAVQMVSPDYFTTIGTPLVRGRFFLHTDDPNVPVAIINQSMARHYFGDADPVGEQIEFSYGRRWNPATTVVGVVADTKMTGLDANGVHEFYMPGTAMGAPETVLVRTRGAATPVAPFVVESIRGLDPDRPVEHIQTLAELRSESIAPQRLNATLFGSFAVLALLIASVGIAGVLAFSVSQRTREIGIRVALGADRGSVLGMIMREGGSMVLAGLVVGCIGAVVLSRFLSGLLFQVEPFDLLTYLVVAATLALVAAAAAAIPARRASGVDPMEALRAE